MTPIYIDELITLSGYDPNQPRVPGGDPDGGEWTDDAAHVGAWKPKHEREALEKARAEAEAKAKLEPDPPGRKRVEVVHETDKALLVKDRDGNEGWIQKRWMRDDNTVSAETLANSVAEKASRQASRDAAAAFRNGFHEYAFARETEKAVGLEVKGEIPNLERDFKRMIWIPKSAMRDGKVPGWIIGKKIDEMKESLPKTDIWIDSVGGFAGFKGKGNITPENENR